MITAKYVYWQRDKWWLGYLQDYPDYWTQGVSYEDLLEHLKDLHFEITNDHLPGVRRVGELVLA